MNADADTSAAIAAILRKRPPAQERCDFCATALGPEHSHLIELEARRILCACRPCYIVFQPEGAAMGKYHAVPDRYREIEGFALSDAEWDDLQIPIGLAFFFYNSLEKKMLAFYPSPAGATESLLPLDTWNEVAARFPIVETLTPDVEAVLVRRNREGSCAYVVPIDAAYELVGLIRTSWKGFDGGAEANAKIDGFFANLGERARGRVTARLS